MDYLKHHLLASPQALLVISRYLASQPQGVGESELQKALQPRAMTPNQDRPARGSGGVSGVLAASLTVGEDLGLLEIKGSTRDRRVWILQDGVQVDVQRVATADSRAFRSLLLRCLCSRAMSAVETNNPPADVAVALTWLLLQDPLTPFPDQWGEGPEAAIDGAGLRGTVRNAEQWRAFMRWARSLGLATGTKPGRQKACLVVDPTRAIEDALDKMPRRAPANQWFAHLHSLLPVFGDPKMVSKLPTGSVASSNLPLASTALAVQKLEQAGRLRLVASADATSTVVLHLGSRVRRIGEVNVLEEAA